MADRVTQSELAHFQTASPHPVLDVRRDGLLTHVTSFHPTHDPCKATFALSTWDLTYKLNNWANEEFPHQIIAHVDRVGLSHPLCVLYQNSEHQVSEDGFRGDYSVGNRRRLHIRRLPRISSSASSQRLQYAKSPYYIEGDNVSDISQVYSYGPSRLVIEWTRVNASRKPVGILLREYLLWQL
jgi:hypothetical protein